MCTQINRPAGYNRRDPSMRPAANVTRCFLISAHQQTVADAGQCDDDQVDFCAVLDWTWARWAQGGRVVLCHRLMASSSDPFSFSSIAGQ